MISEDRSFVADFSNAPDPIDQFLDAVFGEGVGYVAVSFGRVPTTPTFYPWPADKERLLADVERRQAKDNVFFCPALRANEGALKLPENCAKDQSPSLPVEPMPCLWADVDLITKDGTPKSVNVELLHSLGGIQVRSGTPGHVHWYGPLTESVGLDEFDRLNPAVKNARRRCQAVQRVVASLADVDQPQADRALTGEAAR